MKAITKIATAVGYLVIACAVVEAGYRVIVAKLWKRY